MNDEHPTLTEIECLGLKSPFNFADGHAYQDLAPPQRSIVASLPAIWEQSARRTAREAEWLYKDAFAQLAASPSLQAYGHFRICPTASNSIDLVAAWLSTRGMKVGLLEPTFDNLYLLLRRRGVDVVPIAEERLHEGGVGATGVDEVDAIFLVNPNNPTGRALTREQLGAIAHWCRAGGMTLLLDNTFRFFVEQDYDSYELLRDAGVTFVSIEDTGKVWPTQDLKASLVFYSQDIARELEVIYEEVYLCVSSFALGLLTEFFLDAHRRGLAETVFADVAERRDLLRKVLAGSCLAPDPVALESRLSVEWVRVESPLRSDLEAMEYFRPLGLVVLPGRNFFWSGREQHHANVRFSLLKPRLKFLDALRALSEGLSSMRVGTTASAAAA